MEVQGKAEADVAKLRWADYISMQYFSVSNTCAMNYITCSLMIPARPQFPQNHSCTFGPNPEIQILNCIRKEQPSDDDTASTLPSTAL